MNFNNNGPPSHYSETESTPLTQNRGAQNATPLSQSHSQYGTPSRPTQAACAPVVRPTPQLRPVKAFVMQAAQFKHLPIYEYVMPGGELLNFTIVEIIALLPQWFRNYNICARLINNDVSSNIHAALLHEFRGIEYHGLPAKRSASEYVADVRRKIMRTRQLDWLKEHHKVPAGWNANSMNVNNFVPDNARFPNWQAPPPIPFKDLMTDLKKLPTNEDAGDLTRALEFALNNSKPLSASKDPEYVFPDDLHAILNIIGYTQITNQHLDSGAVQRWAAKAKAIASVSKEAWIAAHPEAVSPAPSRAFTQTPLPAPVPASAALLQPRLQPAPVQHVAPHSATRQVPFQEPYQFLAWEQQAAQHVAARLGPELLAQAQFETKPSSSQQQDRASDDKIDPKLESSIAPDTPVLNNNLPVAHAAPDFLEQRPIPAVCIDPELQSCAASLTNGLMTITGEEMDAMVANYQYVPLPTVPYIMHEGSWVPKYRLDFPLRLCEEADDLTNTTDIARAARIVRRWFPVNGDEWTVGRIEFVLMWENSNYHV